MGRPSKPWYRTSHGAWVCRIDGVQYTLAKGSQEKTRAAAAKEFHRLMARRPAASGEPLRVDELCDRFMAHVEADLKPKTFEWYHRMLGKFVAAHGATAATDIRPHHVAEWAGSRGWAQGTRRGAMVAVQTAFRWARRQGHIEANPIAELDKPSPVARRKILSREDTDRVIAAVNEPYAMLLEFLRETGARPGEAARITAADVDWGRGLVVLAEHKTGGRTGRPRVIVLSDRAREILADMCRRHPAGPVFRNTRGNPWTRHAMAHTNARTRVRLGLGEELTAHVMRHRFATDAAATQPNGVVAALLGHSGTATVDRTYCHVSDDIETLRKAVERVRPAPDVKSSGASGAAPDDT